MFTSYLTIPISLPGEEKAGPEGWLVTNPDKVVDCKITPSHVSFYHEGYAWGTFIYMTTGQAICSPLTVAEYELRVENYWKEVNKKLQAQSKIIGLPGSKHHN